MLQHYWAACAINAEGLYVTELIIIIIMLGTSCPIQPSVKLHQWDAPHRLRNTSVLNETDNMNDLSAEVLAKSSLVSST
jgi:hypothetical protein